MINPSKPDVYNILFDWLNTTSLTGELCCILIPNWLLAFKSHNFIFPLESPIIILLLSHHVFVNGIELFGEFNAIISLNGILEFELSGFIS